MVKNQDEVIQTLNGLGETLALDHTQPWNDIYQHVCKDIMPAIDKALNFRFRYNTTELRYVLQQFHRHKRENWKISQDTERARMDKKRKKTNVKRSNIREPYRVIQMFCLYSFIIFILLRKKKDESVVFNICII